MEFKPGVLAELEWRGLVHQGTAEDLRDVLDAGPVTVYLGIDPSGPSLHIGNLVPLTVLKQFQRFGHRVIGLVGGATGMIGDPSGRSSERNLQSIETIAANAASLQRQISAYIGASDNPPIYANNLDWLGPMGLLEFLRDTAKHFSVNAMIHRDAVRSRFDRDDGGISFTEFSYSLLQARDFLELHRRHGCTMQIGGSDQWGNIVSGVELIRRVEGARAFGLTCPLLLTATGAKFGKSEQGAIFCDPAATSPYQFYQYWINTADEDAERYLRMFSGLGRDEIARLAATVGSPERIAQKALARHMTEAIHGPEEAEKAVRASEVLFGGAVAGVPAATLAEIFAEVPAITVGPERFDAPGANLVDLLVEVGACGSKGDARRQIGQGAIRVNGEAIAAGDQDPRIGRGTLIDDAMLVIRRGKRNTYLVRMHQ